MSTLKSGVAGAGIPALDWVWKVILLAKWVFDPKGAGSVDALPASALLPSAVVGGVSPAAPGLSFHGGSGSRLRHDLPAVHPHAVAIDGHAVFLPGVGVHAELAFDENSGALLGCLGECFAVAVPNFEVDGHRLALLPFSAVAVLERFGVDKAG